MHLLPCIADSRIIDQTGTCECRTVMRYSSIANPENCGTSSPEVGRYLGRVLGSSDDTQISTSSYTFVQNWCEAHAGREKPVSKSPYHKILPWEKELFRNIGDAAIVEISKAAVRMDLRSLAAACRQIITMRSLRPDGSRRAQKGKRKGKGPRSLRVMTLEKVSHVKFNGEG